MAGLGEAATAGRQVVNVEEGLDRAPRTREADRPTEHRVAEQALAQVLHEPRAPHDGRAGQLGHEGLLGLPGA